MKYEREIIVSKYIANAINKVLTVQPKSEYDCFSEKQAITLTARFDNGFEMDIKCCGVQYEEGGDNTAWTEAVLFHNGSEVRFTEPSDEFFGEWVLIDGEDEYVVNVKANIY